MSTQTTSLYRSILRELRLGDPVHKFRKHRIASSKLKSLRSAFEVKPAGTQQEATILTEWKELAAFLRAHRQHQALLERYNAGLDMTQAERSRLTARRVGLNMPKEYAEQEEK